MSPKIVLASVFLFFAVFSPAKAQLVLGDSYFITIGYENTGGVTQDQVSIVDTLPTDFSYISCSGGSSCSDNSGEIVWNLGTVPPGASSAVTVTFTVTSCAVPSGLDNFSIDISSPMTAINGNPIAYTVNCPTNSPTPTPTSTWTPIPTGTPTGTFTPAAIFTATSTGTSSFTPTATFTPTFTSTFTSTFTPTSTFTATFTATPSFTPTPTFTPTFTFTSTSTGTPTSTFTSTPTDTPCGFPGNTCTPTPTPYNADIFYVSKNVFSPSNPVSIYVNYTVYPGQYALRVYNSAGEHIKTLDSRPLSGPVSQWYSWDGKNKYGETCASGVYIFYLLEPLSEKTTRILLVR